MKNEKPQPRRRLTDLYLVGKEVSFDDGATYVDEHGQEQKYPPVTLYLRKLNTAEQEDALRRGNAVRSKVLAQAKTPGSFVASNLELQMEDYETKEDLVEACVLDELASRAKEAELEIAAAEEWSKDDFLQGLQDVWATELFERYQRNPEDEEAKAAFEAIQKYVAQVQERLDEIGEELRRKYNDLSLPELREKVYDSKLKYEGNIAWVKEFRRCEIWLAARVEEGSKERYFQSREEVDELDQHVITELMAAYRELTTELTEGK